MNKLNTTATLRLPPQALGTKEEEKEPVKEVSVTIPVGDDAKPLNQEPTATEPVAVAVKEELQADVVDKLPESPVNDTPEKPMEYPTYEAGRLNQFLLRDGTVIKPVDGIYTAKTQEMFDMLNYYAAQQTGLVTPLF